MAVEPITLQLPASIVTPVELHRIAREAEAIDAAMKQGAIRTGGEATNLPKISRLLNDILEANKLNVLHEVDRQNLATMLGYLQTKAPILHISFSVDPSPVFLRQLITWMRENMHSYIMIRIGLQPTIGAGCIVRTDNKYFDLSLRERFTQQRHVLFDTLHQPQKVADEQPA